MRNKYKATNGLMICNQKFDFGCHFFKLDQLGANCGDMIKTVPDGALSITCAQLIGRGRAVEVEVHISNHLSPVVAYKNRFEEYLLKHNPVTHIIQQLVAHELVVVRILSHH